MQTDLEEPHGDEILSGGGPGSLPTNRTTGKCKLPAPAPYSDSAGVLWLIYIHHVFVFDQANGLDGHRALADSALG